MADWVTKWVIANICLRHTLSDYNDTIASTQIGNNLHLRLIQIVVVSV